MRKVIVILLAVLLLLSFTSCNQDKIDELEAQVKQEQAAHAATIKNFEDFMDTHDILKEFYGTKYNGLLTSTEDTFEVTLDSTNASKIKFADDFIKRFATLNNGEELSQSQDRTTTNASGTIKVTKGTNSRTLEFNNTSFDIRYYYTVNNNVASEPREIKGLTISGTLSTTEEKETSDTATGVFSFDGTINGTKYKLSYTISVNLKDTTDYEFTEAKVNGNNVELRLLNKTDLQPIVIGR